MAPLQIYTFPSQDVVKKAAENIADLILEKLQDKQKILVFLSGGSAIEMYQYLFSILQKEWRTEYKNCLHLALVDERYGEYGHTDSNEQQLRQFGILQIAAKLDIQFTGMLAQTNLTAQQTASNANQKYQQLLDKSDFKLLLLGLGEDGHTAGWLPTQSEKKFADLYSGQNTKQAVIFYQVAADDSHNPHRQRLTISTSLLPQCDQVIIFTKGENKKNALQHLIKKDTPLSQTPALIVYSSPEPVIILTDQKQ